MCFTTVSLVTSNILGSSICSLKSLYKKTSQEILAELKADFKTGASKGSEAPTHATQSVMTGVCQQLALTNTAAAYKRKGEEERN